MTTLTQDMLESSLATIASGNKNPNWEEFARDFVYGIGSDSVSLPLNPKFSAQFRRLSVPLRDALREQRMPALLMSLYFYSEQNERQEPATVREAMWCLAIHGRAAAGIGVAEPGSLLLEVSKDLWLLAEKSRRTTFDTRLKEDVEYGWVLPGRYEQLTREAFRQRLE